MPEFKQAIVRKLGENFSEGLTTSNLGLPDPELAKSQHMSYVWNLLSLDIEPVLLEADPAHPDGCFVEDTAVLTDEGAIICRPGHPSRQGETAAIATLLSEVMPLHHFEAPATVDGGDVQRIGRHFLIGQSARTNAEGARQLAAQVDRLGYTSTILPVPGGLHLKSGLSYAGEDRLLVSEEFAAHPALAAYDLIRVEPEESYAANCLHINGHLLIAAGHPRLQEALEKRGIPLTTIEMTEFQKMDGSLTCLSLLW